MTAHSASKLFEPLQYESLEEIVAEAAEAVRPPERLTVDEVAEKYRYLNNPGSYVGPFKMDPVPYLREPMRVLTSLEYRGMIFAGPAQSAKSDMSLSWLAYTVICDPADFMHIDKSQSAARDFYRRRVERLIRDTPAVRERIRQGSHHQSTYSTQFRSGMLFTLSWPTVNELSGKPIGRMWLADYDRMDADVGGEGSPFDLATQRMKTFRRHGMCAAESSPSRPVLDPKWTPSTPHQAPPTTGILSLYNRGDRRRWYWPCAACGTPFEPDFSLFHWPESDNLVYSAENVVMKCPHCGQAYRERSTGTDGEAPGKFAMNLRGFWMADGQTFDPETGEITGEPQKTSIASFWLKGPAAAFAEWSDMTLKYLKAVEEFDNTMSEEALKTTINTDQALPYFPPGSDEGQTPEELKDRAESLGEKEVPEGVRFMLATVDVQAHHFEVQVHGFGANRDVWIIDRFKIRKSNRFDEDGDPLRVNPGVYLEDWDLLTEQVLDRTYPLGDGSGRYMQIRMMAVDSAGRKGVTPNAYDYWRKLRKSGTGLHRRVQLLKGGSRKTAPLVKIDYPDSERKDRRAQARGEVPVMMVNTDSAKDMVSNMLARKDPGGMVHFPKWLPNWWYNELVAETRTATGWKNYGKARNESWDLLVYALALAHSRRVKLPNIKWDDPPEWAEEWDFNALVFGESNLRFESSDKSGKTLEELAEALG